MIQKLYFKPLLKNISIDIEKGFAISETGTFNPDGTIDYGGEL